MAAASVLMCQAASLTDIWLDGTATMARGPPQPGSADTSENVTLDLSGSDAEAAQCVAALASCVRMRSLHLSVTVRACPTMRYGPCPVGVGRLTQLHFLGVHSFVVTQTQELCEQLIHLTYLELWHLGRHCWQDVSLPAGLKHLSWPCSKSLPRSLPSLSALSFLEVSRVDTNAVPLCIQQCSHLTILSLRNAMRLHDFSLSSSMTCIVALLLHIGVTTIPATLRRASALRELIITSGSLCLTDACVSVLLQLPVLSALVLETNSQGGLTPEYNIIAATLMKHISAHKASVKMSCSNMSLIINWVSYPPLEAQAVTLSPAGNASYRVALNLMPLQPQLGDTSCLIA